MKEFIKRDLVEAGCGLVWLAWCAGVGYLLAAMLVEVPF